MAEKWITYSRESYRKGVATSTAYTKLEGEAPPRIGAWEKRPSTPEEIAKEKSRRAEHQRELATIKAFQERPEYIAASAIRNALEWMSPQDHPLDKLSADEWEQLRKKLTE